jgi:isoquinoline 1-oxidoreductase subunit alpha
MMLARGIHGAGVTRTKSAGMAAVGTPSRTSGAGQFAQNDKLQSLRRHAMMFTLKVNSRSFDVDVEAETPLLWVLRDTLGLTGTKFGCGAGICGACTVLVDGAPMRSCMLPVNALAGRNVVTIEKIVENRNNPLVIAWIEEQVPQCGYCQAGQIMAATALLARHPQPTDADIDREMTNICRCGTYAEIRNGIRKASALMAKG